MSRRSILVAFAALIVGLVATSTPRRVGDGAEYLAMAINVSDARAPSLSRRDVARIERHFDAIDSGFDVPALEMPALTGRDGRQDFPHFWFYPALAVPGLWIARILHLHPAVAFTITNSLLLIGALAVALRRLPMGLTILLFVSPVLWWIDKAHADVYTFSLLTIAFVLLPVAGDRGEYVDSAESEPGPGCGWSLAALGAAAAQYPPLAPVWAIVALALLASVPEVRRDGRFWLLASTGAALVVLPAAYYEWRLGVLTPLIGWSRTHAPRIGEIGAFIWDPNIGLLVNFPAFFCVLLVAVGAASAKRHKPDPAVWAGILSAIWLLLAFSQSININHGATPGMNRWTLWLVPPAIPFLREASAAFAGMASAFLRAVVLLSALWCLFYFHPARPESYKVPTRLAQAIWTRWPGLNNPPVEVFSERVSHMEPPLVPVATTDCRKVLMLAGRWPVPCLPPEGVPDRCLRRTVACFANDVSGRYEFVETAMPAGLDVRENVRTWPVAGAFPTHLRRTLDELGLQGLHPAPAGASGSMLRAAHGVEWTYALQSEDRLFVYVAERSAPAVLTLRLPAGMAGAFVDLGTGRPLETVIRAGGDASMPWNLTVPRLHTQIALALKEVR